MTNYTRFVLLGSARTGSNLLASLLNCDSRVVCLGELLAGEFVGISRPGYTKTPLDELMRRRKRDSVEFIDSFVFGEQGPELRAAGFKVFYNQVVEEPEAAVLRRLCADKQVHVVHLRREDLLRQALSLRIAHLTGAWRSDQRKEAKPQPTRIRYGPEQLKSFFEQRTAEYEHHRRLFADHPVLELTYETIADDPIGSAIRTLEFLGVPDADSVEFEVKTKKQVKRTPRDLLKNYDEVFESLTNTEWGYLFE